MIIAIDGYEANERNRVGIGRFAFEILCHIYKLFQNASEEEKKSIQFRIYIPENPNPDMPKETSWWQYRVIQPKKFWTFFALPKAIFFDRPKADVIFSPTHYVPRFITTPRVMAVMDLSYLIYPSLFKKKDLHQLVHWTAYSIAHSKRICTISQFTKHAIMDTYKVPSERIVVTYPGLTMGDVTEIDIVKKYNVSEHFILSVGTVQPRKNYIKLIEAFALFLSQNKQKFGVIDLVIVGKKGWLFEEILEAPKKYGVSERVKFLDFVPDEDLHAFYRKALCFALPSLYEGFGLPVLEAMANKCPVVVSDVSSLPEIAGKAGVYVDPQSVESIAKGLLAAVRERNLMQGKNRIKAGIEQVKKFTWEHAAENVLQVLKEVASTNS